MHPVLDFAAVFLGELQAERHVVEDRHVRVQRVGLKHHRHAALRWRDVVDLLAADGHLAGRDVLQPGDQAQQGGFTAAGRPDEDRELAILDIEIDALDDPDVFERLADAAHANIGHRESLLNRMV